MRHIQHAATTLIAGLPKTHPNFYAQDIEEIIAEAKILGDIIADVTGHEDARLTDQKADAVRAAFRRADFRTKDTEWKALYEAARAAGEMPDATKEAWWDAQAG